MYINDFETFVSKLKHEAKKQNADFLKKRVISVRLDNPANTRIVFAGNILRYLFKIPKEKYKDLQIIVCKDDEELKKEFAKIKGWGV